MITQMRNSDIDIRALINGFAKKPSSEMLGLFLARRASSLAHPLPKISKGSCLVPNNPRYKRLMELQTHFCINDGKVVWQKMPYDLDVYRVLVGVVSCGFLLTLFNIYKLTLPPVNEDE